MQIPGERKLQKEETVKAKVISRTMLSLFKEHQDLCCYCRVDKEAGGKVRDVDEMKEKMT